MPKTKEFFVLEKHRWLTSIAKKAGCRTHDGLVVFIDSCCSRRCGWMFCVYKRKLKATLRSALQRIVSCSAKTRLLRLPNHSALAEVVNGETFAYDAAAFKHKYVFECVCDLCSGKLWHQQACFRCYKQRGPIITAHELEFSFSAIKVAPPHRKCGNRKHCRNPRRCWVSHSGRINRPNLRYW